MRSRYFRTLAAAGTFFILLGVGVAQNTTLISLDQAIDLGLAHNHSIKATRTMILQSQAQEITANLRPNPGFGADSQFIPIFCPGDFSADDLNLTQQFGLGISYLFERGHKRQRRLQAARDQTAVTRAQVTDAERTLAFNVGQQFVSVLLAESTLQFAQQDLKDFQTTVDIADAQFKAGAISEADYLKIKLQLLQFQTDVSSAPSSGVDNSQSACSVFLCRLCGALCDLSGVKDFVRICSKIKYLTFKGVWDAPRCGNAVVSPLGSGSNPGIPG
jgi:cobalt-zinc-cadmium efflux system outer membrane protein